MSIKFDKIVTTALLYANGPLHLGHLVEHIQADTWIRFQRMSGKKCLFIGGNDAHGTPIMLSSEKQNIPTNQLVQSIHKQHKSQLEKFHIHYDQFCTTHDQENKDLTLEIFATLQNKDLIITKEIEQPYDIQNDMFLPDRYIKGGCPKCEAKDQYGDNCEACGVTYAASELVNPISVLSNTPPISKKSIHYFFKLSKCQSMLKQWLDQLDCNKSVINKLLEWFADGLQDWDISRDKPYFGFNIPNEANKYFYVWLDAPIGYLAACKQYCNQHNIDFGSLLNKQSQTELIHFIGKDITYFHALFWPALLSATQYKLPDSIYTHGFLTINKAKMSKSRNTYITAEDYLAHLDPDCLRFYLCSKLSNKVEDIDFNWTDFKTKNDSELVGKLINIASRCAKLLAKHFDNTLSPTLTNEDLYTTCLKAGDLAAHYYEERNFNKAIKTIMTAADTVNQYLAKEAPWSIVKANPQSQKAHDICSLGIQCFRCLVTYLKPVTPGLAIRAELFLNHTTKNWNDCKQPLLNQQLNQFSHLMRRIEATTIEKCTNSNND